MVDPGLSSVKLPDELFEDQIETLKLALSTLLLSTHECALALYRFVKEETDRTRVSVI